ncbi:unnamed protein product, partial [Phaeothamnion confervicola]
LVVGGTDGSGTRGVVALLQRLGVPMVIEDYGTLDVHASYMVKGGWPEAVRPVLQLTHSPQYAVCDVEAPVREATLRAVKVLAEKMRASS